MTKTIEKTAKDYQTVARQIKELEAKAKPLKAELIEYAEEHRKDFDASFQLKFACGAYISQRVADVLEGAKDDKLQLIAETGDEFAKVDLDEKAVLAEAPKNDRLRKLLTKLGLKVAQKESLAVYAG